jgi:DNA-directed RNA polymerase I subunit RPA1
VRALSTVQLSSPTSFNQLGHPLEGGLYDLRMGPFSDRDRVTCSTCHQTAEHCPGHIGHIELPLPVVNSLFYKTLHHLLKITCIYCHRFKMPDYSKTLFLVQQKLLDAGLINAAQEAGELAERREDKEEKKASKRAKDRAGDIEMNNRLRALGEKHLAGAGERDYVPVVDRQVRSVEGLRKEYAKRTLALGKETTCSQCGAVTRKVSLYKSRLIIEGLRAGEDTEAGEEPEVPAPRRKAERGDAAAREKWELNATELRDHIRALWSVDHELLGRLFPVLRSAGAPQHPTDLLFLEVLPVPPPRARPVQFTGGLLTLHPQSQALQRVLEAAAVMRPLVQVMRGQDVAALPKETQELIKHLRGESVAEQLDLVWKELQMHVDHVIDRDLNATRNQKTGWGFKQLIERKQGIFRMHMMGKRVNHACRTVITPDPMIEIGEIGIPEVFATTLTYQVPVTPWNVSELRDMVLNGPEVHPGAVAVEDEKGWTVRLDPKDRAQREGIAKTLLTPSSDQMSGKPKIVYRHLKNGDAMLLNRQPTLHRPGIMAHRARVLKGEKVMRLHYSNCKSYNADFDGDEMNAHFPQSEMARAEAYHMVASPKQFLVPKDGTPLQGLIQDHVIAGVKMTLRGRFFERGEYQQLVYGALVDLPGRIRLLPPAIRKPRLLWSGKQLVSTIILNLVPAGQPPPNLASSAKIKAELWENASRRPWRAGGSPNLRAEMTESEVVIRGGLLCAGILDKQQYGATPYSLAHLFAELYGGEASCRLLSCFSKLFTNFLRSEGFTLGVEDILVTDSANRVRQGIMRDTEVQGDSCAASGVGLVGEHSKEQLSRELEDAHRASATVPRRRMEVDRGFKAVLNKATDAINKVCLPEGLIQKFPANNLQLMVNSGAKGSTVNTMQISCLLGQIELEGKRPPIMISGASLPAPA